MRGLIGAAAGEDLSQRLEPVNSLSPPPTVSLKHVLMQGYSGQAEVTENGRFWFTKVDLGTFDEGDLFIVERRSDLFFSGGESVYAAEVENILQTSCASAAVMER